MPVHDVDPEHGPMIRHHMTFHCPSCGQLFSQQFSHHPGLPQASVIEALKQAHRQIGWFYARHLDEGCPGVPADPGDNGVVAS